VVSDLKEGDVLLEVFGQVNPNLWGGDAREAAPEFVELARRLRFVADGISAKYDLTTFFREVEKAGVSPALESGREQEIEFSSKNRDTDGVSMASELRWPIELYQPTYVCYYERCGDLPAYPLVVLGAWNLFDRPFQYTVSPVSKTRRKNANRAQMGWPAVVLSFCIAPIGEERSATPVLRVDLRATLRGLGWIEFRTGHHTVGDHKITIKNIPELPPPFASDVAKRHAFEVMFLPVNGTVCEAGFKFCAFEDEYFALVDEYYHHDLSAPVAHAAQLLPHPAQDESLCAMFGLQAPFSSFGSGTLAGLIDTALCHPTGGLDQLLEQQTKRLKDAFEASQKSIVDRRNQSWEVVKNRWERHEDQ
jgi:hypothetical protein